MTTGLVRSMTATIRRMKAARPVSLTYTRGSDSVELTGWAGNTGFSFLSRVNAEPSTGAETSNAEFMIVADELILSGSAITPRIGDTIEAAINSLTVDYVVVPVNQGESCWNWLDEQTRLVYQIKATATPWTTATVYRPAATSAADGLRVANLAAVYAGMQVKFIPSGGRFETTENRVTTRKKYKAMFRTNTVELLAGDVIDVSGTKYEITGQIANGRTSQLPECDCERIE